VNASVTSAARHTDNLGGGKRRTARLPGIIAGKR
jgi:hypothetical protein